MNWKDYQERAADFFRSIGLEAETDITIEGVRTKHDIDVLVKSRHVGFNITWLVECKYWKSRVSKLHVLALREIVADTGADRGILLAEKGYQSGAIEASNLTNVELTSLEHLKGSASNAINSMKLKDLFDRLSWCKYEYWEIPKSIRIKEGLRPDASSAGYSGQIAIACCEDIITKAFRNDFPINPDRTYLALNKSDLIGVEIPIKFKTQTELTYFLELVISNLEDRINKCNTI